MVDRPRELKLSLRQGSESTTSAASDEFLIASLRGGDSHAFQKLMDRYDRLVRYVIFRTARQTCLVDPEWLDSVATDVWVAFIRGQSGDQPEAVQSISGLLSTIAARRTVSAVRTRISESKREIATLSHDGVQLADENAIEASDLASELELLETLRDCSRTLEGPAAQTVTKLDLILARKWEQAAKELGCAESTLRSRWKVTLEFLRECMRQKLGGDFAPDLDFGD